MKVSRKTVYLILKTQAQYARRLYQAPSRKPHRGCIQQFCFRQRIGHVIPKSIYFQYEEITLIGSKASQERFVYF